MERNQSPNTPAPSPAMSRGARPTAVAICRSHQLARADSAHDCWVRFRQVPLHPLTALVPAGLGPGLQMGVAGRLRRQPAAGGSTHPPLPPAAVSAACACACHYSVGLVPLEPFPLPCSPRGRNLERGRACAHRKVPVRGKMQRGRGGYWGRVDPVVHGGVHAPGPVACSGLLRRRGSPGSCARAGAPVGECHRPLAAGCCRTPIRYGANTWRIRRSRPPSYALCRSVVERLLILPLPCRLWRRCSPPPPQPARIQCLHGPRASPS